MREWKEEMRAEVAEGREGEEGGRETLHLLHDILLICRFLRSVRFPWREWNLLRYVRTTVTVCAANMAHPCGSLSCTQSYGSFPSEMSVLEVEDELEWNPSVPAVSSMPLSIYDDGAILYYK